MIIHYKSLVVQIIQCQVNFSHSIIVLISVIVLSVVLALNSCCCVLCYCECCTMYLDTHTHTSPLIKIPVCVSMRPLHLTPPLCSDRSMSPRRENLVGWEESSGAALVGFPPIMLNGYRTVKHQSACEQPPRPLPLQPNSQ